MTALVISVALAASASSFQPGFNQALLEFHGALGASIMGALPDSYAAYGRCADQSDWRSPTTLITSPPAWEKTEFIRQLRGNK